MKVITGLDGSGKTTILDELENRMGEKISVLRVPTIESEKFIGDKLIYDQCQFINYLGEKADEEGAPSLKIISMFGAMLLFKDLVCILENSNRAVFSERHPLVDTIVYAKAYFNVMNPELLDLNLAKSIEEDYRNELLSIVNRTPVEIKHSTNGLMYDLLNFLYDWFSEEENYSVKKMKNLFGIDEPELIYFLDVPTSVLIDRIAKRNRSEYHETEQLLDQMKAVYQMAFSETHISVRILISDKASCIPVILDAIAVDIGDHKEN